MTMVNSSTGGICLAISVNLTPMPLPIPIPYVIAANRFNAIPNVIHVLICGGPAHNMGTVIAFCVGDQLGICGGMASGTVGSTCRNFQGSRKVYLCGMPITRMTDGTLQNSTNANGAGVSPCQVRVFVMS